MIISTTKYDPRRRESRRLAAASTRTDVDAHATTDGFKRFFVSRFHKTVFENRFRAENVVLARKTTQYRASTRWTKGASFNVREKHIFYPVRITSTTDWYQCLSKLSVMIAQRVPVRRFKHSRTFYFWVFRYIVWYLLSRFIKFRFFANIDVSNIYVLTWKLKKNYQVDEN